MTTLTIEQFRDQTKAEIERGRRMSESDPERARREAVEKLTRYGFIDGTGNLAPQFRG